MAFGSGGFAIPAAKRATNALPALTDEGNAAKLAADRERGGAIVAKPLP